MPARTAKYPWQTIMVSGVVLALGAGVVDWLDYRQPIGPASGIWYVGVIATAFLALGTWTGWRLRHPAPVDAPAAEPDVAQRLGISRREMEVLDAIALGLTTKEIARLLELSPNTVKSHTSRLFEKLPATNRTQATARARELGLVR